MSNYELEVFAYIEWCKKHNLDPKKGTSLSAYCREKNNERKEK